MMVEQSLLLGVSWLSLAVVSGDSGEPPASRGRAQKTMLKRENGLRDEGSGKSFRVATFG